jgi:hypothetical protein
VGWAVINPSFVKLNELIPEDDWEYFEDREMSMREAAGRIVMKDVKETLDQRENRYGDYKRVSATSQTVVKKILCVWVIVGIQWNPICRRAWT